MMEKNNKKKPPLSFDKVAKQLLETPPQPRTKRKKKKKKPRQE